MKRLILVLLLNLLAFSAFTQTFTYTDNGLPCAKNDYTFTPQVTGADNITWDFDDGTQVNTADVNASINHSFSDAGIYTVTLSAYNGATLVGTYSEDITVYDAPNLKMTYEAPSLVCAPNDVVYLTIDSTNIEAPDLKFTIDWGDGTAPETFVKSDLGDKKAHQYSKTSCGSSFVIAGQSITDKFLITVSATNICTSFSPSLLFRTVDIKSAPNVGFSVDQSNTSYDSVSQTFYVCDQADITLKNDSYGTNNCLEVDNVHWQIFDQNNNLVDECLNTCTDKYIVSGLDYGKYTVVLTQDNACGAGSTSRKIEIRKPPLVDLEPLDDAFCYPTRITFDNLSADEVTKFWWDFTGDSTHVLVDSVKQAQQWVYTEAGTYTVKLWGTDGYCLNYDDTTLVLENRCKDIYVPNAFIPTSSDPLLNNFRPKAQDLTDYRIDIYDLYGRHIWSSTALNENGAPSEGWDGNCPDGSPCDPGTYIWVIKATISYGDLGETVWDGQEYNKKGKRSTSGTFILIRQ